jgi:hypothetical protein
VAITSAKAAAKYGNVDGMQEKLRIGSRKIADMIVDVTVTS